MTRAKGSSSRPVLIAATTLVTVIVFECGLRLMGPALTLWNVRPSVLGGEDIRILTLGESTTADDYGRDSVSWPRQLEAMLRERGVKARVLNVAEPGISTIELLERLPPQLDAWRPDLVISMMGINDAPHLFSDVVGKSGWSSLYLVRFAKAVVLVCKLLWWELKTPVPDAFSFPETASILSRLKKGKDASALAELDRLLVRLSGPKDRARYLAYLGQELVPPSGASAAEYEVAHDLLLRSHETYPGVEGVDRELAYEASTFKRYGECMRIASDYFARGILADSENISRVFFRCRLASPNLPGWSKIPLPEPFQVARGNSLDSTRESYRRLAGMLKTRGIRYFAMAYPQQSVEVLRDHFREERGKGELLPPFASIGFISNEKSFEMALKRDGWDHLFIDRFAGTFGHATSEGNRLIAFAALQAILPAIGLPRTSRGD